MKPVLYKSADIRSSLTQVLSGATFQTLKDIYSGLKQLIQNKNILTETLKSERSKTATINLSKKTPWQVAVAAWLASATILANSEQGKAVTEILLNTLSPDDGTGNMIGLALNTIIMTLGMISVQMAKMYSTRRKVVSNLRLYKSASKLIPLNATISIQTIFELIEQRILDEADKEFRYGDVEYLTDITCADGVISDVFYKTIWVKPPDPTYSANKVVISGRTDYRVDKQDKAFRQALISIKCNALLNKETILNIINKGEGFKQDLWRSITHELTHAADPHNYIKRLKPEYTPEKELPSDRPWTAEELQEYFKRPQEVKAVARTMAETVKQQIQPGESIETALMNAIKNDHYWAPRFKLFTEDNKRLIMKYVADEVSKI